MEIPRGKKRHDIKYDFLHSVNQRLPEAYNRSPGFHFDCKN